MSEPTHEFTGECEVCGGACDHATWHVENSGPRKGDGRWWCAYCYGTTGGYALSMNRGDQALRTMMQAFNLLESRMREEMRARAALQQEGER